MNSNDEEDETDAFEIIDHTVASPWERFIARVEEILRNWSSIIESNEQKEGEEAALLEETVTHANRTYTLTYISAVRNTFDDTNYSHLPTRLQVLMDTSSDFAQNGHDIQRWFGVEDFVCILPESESTDMSEASLLLSSLTMAADASLCNVPLFVPIGERYEGRYIGYMIEKGKCARFSCENFPSGSKPGQFGNLENLVEYFHKQLNAGKTRHVDLTPATTVAARFTYSREDWFDEWRGKYSCATCDEERRRILQESPKENVHLSTSYRANSDIYWGPLSDPLASLQLGAVWKQDAMPKSRFWVDNKIRTDFKPRGAPIWNLQAAFRDFEKACPLTLNIRVLLTAYVESTEAPSLHLFSTQEALASSKKKNTTEQGQESPAEQKQGLVQVVETLTRSITSLNSPVVPTQQELDAIVRDLFAKNGNEEVVEKIPLHQVRSLLLKGAPPFSLAADLACRMLDMQCLPAIALLWIEFVKEVRWCWEHCMPITRTPFDQIDPSACLIHQKLQMLNYCLGRKIKERKKKPKSRKTPTSELEVEAEKPNTTESEKPKPIDRTPKVKLDSWDEPEAPVTKNSKDSKTEEDFFRILNEPEATVSPSLTLSTASRKEKSSEGNSLITEESDPAVAAVADGWDTGELDNLTSGSEGDDDDFQDAKDDKILSLDGWDDLPDLDLSTQYLLYREKSIVPPETQDSGVMTEDMLKDQIEIFKSLGTSEEATLIRAKLQTPSLKSDMESFKAENEGCVLEDFVRWYSPRDWITPDAEGYDPEIVKQSDAENGGEIRGKGLGRDGHLSARMRAPGNLWRLLWKEAEAIPASKQVPLFKHATEAEKVLHYLENVTLPDLIQQLISVVLNVLLYTFKPTSLNNSQDSNPPPTPHSHTTPPLGVDLPPFADSFENFLRAIESYWPEYYTKETPIQVENLTNLWQEFQKLECMAAKSTSLLQKMPGKPNIVSHLLNGEEVAIPQNLRVDFTPIFFPDNSDSVRADTREYIIRCPTNEYEPIPNRLYACISTHEAKVATAFTMNE